VSTLVYVAAIAGMLLLLIGPHEAGHLAMAKLFKVRVMEFAIGAGPKLWSITRAGTLYAIRAIPILGYVRMGGMEDGDFDDPQGFHTKPAWQRILILVGGPAVNFLVAIVIVAGLGLTQLNSDPGKVLNVVVGSPAAAAGLRPQDSIQSVNGQAFHNTGLVRELEDASPGAPLTLTGRHADGTPFTYVISPHCDAQNACQIGIGLPRRLQTVQTALSDAVAFPYTVTSNLVQGLNELITGKVAGGLLGPNGLTGTVGIAVVAQQSAAEGFDNWLFLVAVVSVALGFTNLLPLPALDGGRILVVLVEVLRRRPFDRATELRIQRFGLVALLILAVFINLHDVQLILTKQFPGLR
jgi:regulator of sigma E protease